MTPELTLIAAFLIGIAGSPHCLGMCGGIAASLGTASAHGGLPSRGLYALSYNLGRLASYTLMGALFASLVALVGLSVAAPSWAAFVRIATALVLLAVAAHLLFDWRGLRRIEAVGAGVWRRIRPVAQRLLPVRSAPAALALGGLWGWLPCGLVYTVLIAAAVSANPLTGAAIMLAFGLGTLPSMTGVTLFGQVVQRWQSRRGLRRGLGLLMLAFALWTLVSPLSALLGGGHHHGQQAATDDALQVEQVDHQLLNRNGHTGTDPVQPLSATV